MAELPSHIAIIMDGNGRWAKQRGQVRVQGHRKGVAVLKDLVPACGRRGVKNLTLFAFSSENWRRPESEVRILIELFTSTLTQEVANLHEHGVRLRCIGDLSRFPKRLRQRVAEAESKTAQNTTLQLSLAVNYGGRWDVTQACRKLAQEVADGVREADSIDEQAIADRLSLGELPDPDLFIRTGGEKRISNFMLWQLSYAEMYFTDVYWPDFDDDELDKALAHFAQRERRYGQISEQLIKEA